MALQLPPRATAADARHAPPYALLRQQYYEQRSATIKALRQSQNPNPYPHKFNVTIGVPAFIEKYDSICNEPGSRLGDITVRPLAPHAML